MITTLKDFLADTNELEMFITGSAGTGKTTAIINIVKYLVTQRITFQVVSYTHQAKGVLLEKLPVLGTEYVTTLHSWLKKRPSVNSRATNVNSLLVSSQYGDPVPLQVLIVDEFSFVGQRDYFSIGDLQEDSLANKLKVIYVGDPKQLTPVKDIQIIYPHNPYWINLTTVWRTATSDLSITIDKFAEFIGLDKDIIPKIVDTKDLTIVRDDSEFIEIYKKDTQSKRLLTFTNFSVQEYNIAIQGHTTPEVGNVIYCHSFKKYYTITNIFATLDTIDELTVPSSPYIITDETKYNPFKILSSIRDIKYYELDNSIIVPAIFGTYNFKVFKDTIAHNLVNKNKKGLESKKEYHLYKTINDYLVELDYIHALTIHKSQGSEYANIYIDYDNVIMNCISNMDRLKLLYVGLSRAKQKIFLSSKML